MAIATQQTIIDAGGQFADEASELIRSGKHCEVSRLLWDAATRAIEEASDRMGWQLEPRRVYADVMSMLAPWYPLEQTSPLYSSLLFLRDAADEDYGLDDDAMHELAEDIRDLIEMLESVR